MLAEPSTPSPTGAPARLERRTGQQPEARIMLEVGQWLIATWARPRRRISGSSNQMPWASQTRLVEPAEALEIVERAAAEARAAPGVLVLGLGEVGVQADLVPSGERGACRASGAR